MDVFLGALNLAIEDGKWTRKEWEHYLEVDILTPYYSLFDSDPHRRRQAVDKKGVNTTWTLTP